MILLSHNFWLHSKAKILFTSFDLYFKSFSFVDMLVDLFWGFCGLAIHFCDNIAWLQTTPERKKAYSWTSPQKPPWGQKKVAIVERFTQDLKWMDCPSKKSGHCRKVAVVVKWALVEVWLYLPKGVVRNSLSSGGPSSLFLSDKKLWNHLYVSIFERCLSYTVN